MENKNQKKEELTFYQKDVDDGISNEIRGGVYRDVKIRDFFYTVKLSCSPVEQRANCERKTGAKELKSSLRGTPI